MRYKILCVLCIAALLCHSCSFKQQHVLFENRPTTVSDTALSQFRPPAYRIRPDDILQIRNLNLPVTNAITGNISVGNTTTSLAGAIPESYQVEEDGRVTLPVLGHVPIAGLTRYDAARKIEALYRDSLLRNPIIELKILNLKVTLFGEVKAPGNIPLLNDHTTLIDVIGQAGGLTNGADEKNIKIIHRNKPVPETVYVDLGSINTVQDPRILLQNNDVIYIAQNKRAVRDDKIQNFSTLVQPSLLIFNTALIIYTLFRK